MKILAKALNPLIWCWNVLNYFAHLETKAGHKPFVPYDFSKDVKYF